MSQSTGVNQVPTSATNQQTSTPASTAPMYGPTPAAAPAAAATPSGINWAQGYTPSYAPQDVSAPPMPTVSWTPAASAPPPSDYSAGASGMVTGSTTGGVPNQTAPNPFSQPAPTAPAPQTNPFTAPTAQGDFNIPYTSGTVGGQAQPGIFVNAQGFASPDSVAAAQQAMVLRGQAVDRGYQWDNSTTALGQKDAMQAYLQQHPAQANPFAAPQANPFLY